MDQYDTYNLLLNHATEAAHARLRFEAATVRAFDDGRIDIEHVRRLIPTYEHVPFGKVVSKPSRATAYRRLDQWRGMVAELGNPGRGA